jgi:predicted transcriptional regulator
MCSQESENGIVSCEARFAILSSMDTKNRVGSTGILTASELKMFVTVKIQMSGLDAKGYAEKMGVPHQTIYSIMSGARLPSKSLLKKLGLEIVYRIVPETGRK